MEDALLKGLMLLCERFFRQEGAVGEVVITKEDEEWLLQISSTNPAR